MFHESTIGNKILATLQKGLLKPDDYIVCPAYIQIWL